MGVIDRLKAVFSRRDSGDALAKTATTSAEVALNTPRVIDRMAREPRWVYSLSSATESGMTASLWVYCCASLIANSVASLPLRVMKGKRALQRHALLDLLKRPHPQMRLKHWQAARAYNLLLTGTDYVHVLRASAMGESRTHRGAGLPHELWPYPEGEFRTKVEPFGAPRITGYERCTGGLLKVTERDVIRTMSVRPGREGAKRGLAPLEAAAREASMDDAAADWQRNSFANRAVPDGAFELESVDQFGTPLDEKQLNEARKHLKEAWSGATNAREPMVYGSAKWIQMALSAVDMDFIASRDASGKAICAAFGVPDVLFRASSSTFSNLPAARAWFWDTTVLPLAELLVEGLSDELAPEFGPDLSIDLDKTRVHALLQLELERWAVADKALDRGAPMSVVSPHYDLGVPEYPDWDVGRVASTQQPITIITPGASAPGSQEAA